MANSRDESNKIMTRTTVNLSTEARETLKALAYAMNKSYTFIINESVLNYSKTKKLEQEVKDLRHAVYRLKTNHPEECIL